MVGKVICSGFDGEVGVEFNKNVFSGHTCDGLCRNGRGLYFSETELITLM